MPKNLEPGEPAPGLRREALVVAALRVLQQRGYAAVTARKIAAEAQMSLGHISYHFADMDEVMSEVYRLATRLLHETEAQSERGEGGHPLTARDRFARFVKAGFTEEILTPEYLRMRVDLWSAALTRPEIAKTELELYSASRARLEAILRDMSHYSRADRVPAVCDLVMAALDGLWLDWIRRRDRASVNRGLEMVQKLATLELS